MTLTDAGPLIAILDRNDRDHAACVAALDELTSPLVTTWPAYTEAMYLLGDRAGWAGQELLWRMALRGDLVVRELDQAAAQRSRDLMEKYRDVPMDLADATLVALAERLAVARVFTLDDDFRVYRIRGRKAFEIVP
jgi:predicted nucleic acid-binding protein